MTRMVTKREVPLTALRLPATACLAVEPTAADSPSDQPTDAVPVTLTARTGQPIEHWYWGRMVHDMAGLQLHKDRVPLDYCHDPGDVVGYLDSFDTSTGDLVCTGALVPFEPTDRAAEIIHKARAGVPYESSIAFEPDDIEIENVPVGKTAEVNGYTLTGPAVIFRRWSLRGVAICPYGNDKNTPVELDQRVQLSLFTLESAMATYESPVDDRAELQRFLAAFGAENGAKWYLERKPFADACALHIEHLTAQLSARTAERNALQQQIAELTAAKTAAEHEAAQLRAENDRLRRGELMPVSGGDFAEPAPKQTAPIGGLSQGLARFAASLKLPAA